MISEAQQITVQINNEPRSFAASVTLLAALRQLELSERRGIAIAIDGAVVPRVTWATRHLADGERVLVIQATQGG